MHLCRSVIRSIETARLFDLDEFPVKDKVNIENLYMLMHMHGSTISELHLYIG